MSDLYANSSWAQTLLPLVARGNSIISEISRLSDFIPPIFLMDLKNPKHKKFQDIIIDFYYFHIKDLFDSKIDSKAEMQDLDDEFRENHIQILDRFYRVFESVHKYISDLNHFLTSLDEGLFVHHNLVSVMLDEDGKQLMCEALYLYGVMLLLIDRKIEGVVRERMLVSFLRYSAKSSNSESNIDDVCSLLRSTGFSIAPGAKRPASYPDDYFHRVPIDQTYVSMVIDKLCSDDLYNQLRAFPFPEHRSHARATQASMIYVCLYFAPHILQQETAKMREIVDKHYPDNWVISIHMGQVVNLLDSWLPYKAAGLALANTVEPNLVKQLCKKHTDKVQSCRISVRKLLKEGVLEPNYVLDNISKLMDVVRECNVTIRWLMLHSAPLDIQADANKKCKQMRELVLTSPGFSLEAVLNLLVVSAQYEFKLNELFKDMLNNREVSWGECKKEGIERMQELSDVFSGTKALTRVEKNDKLQKWFSNLGQQIENLDIANITAAGRKLDQLIQALTEVLEYHQLGNNVLVKKFIEETCANLQQMLRIINLQESVVLNLNICADISYAIHLMPGFTGYLQQQITIDPYLVTQLKATFLKLAVSHDLPLIRLNQCESTDLLSVSEYYSSELVSYVRNVLQIVPQTMFSKLSTIVKLQTHSLPELPVRLEKDKLKDFARLEDRNRVAQLTRDIAVFTEGILMMKTTLVGVIEVDPHKLLEDGIRKELVNRVSKALHEGLIFNPKAKKSELIEKLDELGDSMNAFRRSFEYIQDYVNIHGLRLWQEEVARVILYNVEQECNQLRRNTVHEWQSQYQMRSIPIPKYSPVDKSQTFIGRLMAELLRITDPKTSIYVEVTSTWYDAKTKKEVMYMRVFDKIMKAVDTFGLSGIDKMLGFLVVRKMQELMRYIRRSIHDDKRVMETLNSLVKQIKPVTGVTNPRNYQDVHLKLKVHMTSFLDILQEIGQLQLLRQMLANHLKTTCKFESKFLYSALQAMNGAMLQEVRRHMMNPAQHPYPGGQGTGDVDHGETPQVTPGTDLIVELNQLFHATGMHEPLMQVYITTKPVNFASLLVFLAVTSCSGRLSIVKSVGALIPKKPGSSDSIDGVPVLIGCVSFLRQLHVNVCNEFLVLMGQFVRTHLASLPSVSGKNPIYPAEVLHCLSFLHDFSVHFGLPAQSLQNFIPEYILAEYYSQIAGD